MTFPEGRILPLVIIDDADNADALADTLLEAGIQQVEVTLRTPRALEAARRMVLHDGLTVGVGTAVTVSQVDHAAEIGASFIVSPGLIEAVVERTLELDLCPVPGIATPSELLRAVAFGLDMVKVFPAEQLGGTAMISALNSVFPEIRLVPSGGIGPHNARDYLSQPGVAAIGGSWMTPRQAIGDKDFAGIAMLCRSAVELAR